MKRGPPAPETGAFEGMFSRRNELAPHWVNSFEQSYCGERLKVRARFQCGVGRDLKRRTGVTEQRDIDKATEEVLAKIKPSFLFCFSNSSSLVSYLQSCSSICSQLMKHENGATCDKRRVSGSNALSAAARRASDTLSNGHKQRLKSQALPFLQQSVLLEYD